MGSKSDKLIHRGNKALHELQEDAKDYGEVATDYIKDHPVKSTLIAGAIGIVAGLLFKIRH